MFIKKQIDMLTGKVHEKERKAAFESLASHYWTIERLEAREVRELMETVNECFFEPRYNVNEFNDMCYKFFISCGNSNPEFWDRDFPFVITTYDSGGNVRYKIDFKLLAAHVIDKGKYFFVGELIYLYDDAHGVYERVSNEMFRGYVLSFVNALSRSLSTTSGIDGAVKDIKSDRSHVIVVDDMDADMNLINFQNGLLNLKTLELLPHSPEVFSTVQVKCNWNPDAEECTIFNDFLNTLLSGHDEMISFIWQYTGLAMSNIPGYKSKKALILYGSGNTGKSRYYELLQRLIGGGNCCSISINDLEERFGTSVLFGKRLAGDADMKAMRVKEMSIFKKLTGGDPISFEFKGKDILSGIYKGLLLFCCNELPKFGGDKGEHVYERMVILKCSNVIPAEKRDPMLIEKMCAELESIAYYAVMYLKNFIEKGYSFDIPDSSKTEIQKYIIENDNVMQFLEECTVLREKAPNYQDVFTCANMYRAYVSWARDSGVYICNKSEFVKSACNYYKFDDAEKIRMKKSGKSFYWFVLKSDCYSLCGFADVDVEI